MKPQGPLGTTITSVATPSRCSTLILMAIGHQRIGRRISGHLRKKETQETLIKDQPSIAREVTHKTVATVVVETHILSKLHTACFMAMRQTIGQKTASYS
jgi:hypothetical protein